MAISGLPLYTASTSLDIVLKLACYFYFYTVEGREAA